MGNIKLLFLGWEFFPSLKLVFLIPWLFFSLSFYSNEYWNTETFAANGNNILTQLAFYGLILELGFSDIGYLLYEGGHFSPVNLTLRSYSYNLANVQHKNGHKLIFDKSLDVQFPRDRRSFFIDWRAQTYLSLTLCIVMSSVLNLCSLNLKSQLQSYRPVVRSLKQISPFKHKLNKLKIFVTSNISKITRWFKDFSV